MKKKKVLQSPNLQHMFRREKDLLSIINNPKKMEAVLELGRAANKLERNLTATESLDEWTMKVLQLLPANMTSEEKEDFGAKLMEFVNGYRSESERNDSTDCE